VTDLTKPRPPETKGTFAVGEYIMAQDGRRMRPARVVQRDEEKYVVEFYNYSDKARATLPEGKLQKIIRPKTYPAGATVAVLWQNKPYMAKILKVELDFHLITYPGWSNDWDEWILADRILGDYKLEEAPRIIEVEWRGGWHRAVALAAKDGKHYVRYLGHAETWNEWVPTERMREVENK
jgi:hypothetical protein